MKLKNYKERIAAIPESTKEKVRMNNRIHEILKENTEIAPDSDAARPILRAMGQYGKECHADGMREGHSHGIAWAEKYLPELIKLRELVKAQKELIVSLGKLSLDEHLTSKEWDRMDELRNKIKTLES